MMEYNDLTFQQAWDVMMYNYRKKLHLERLEKQYQLQQLQVTFCNLQFYDLH